MVRSALLVLLLQLVACGGKGAISEPQSPSSPSPSEPTTNAADADAQGAAAEAEPAPERKRKPFEIHSGCAEVVTLVFGDDPKAADAVKQPMAPRSTLQGQRDKDGNQTVWLLDDNGEPLIKVNVTRGMKRVEIGRSCRTLDAR